MRTLLILFCVIFFFASCKDNKEKEPDEINSDQPEYVESNDYDSEDYDQDGTVDQNNETPDTSSAKDSAEGDGSGRTISGTYIKNDHLEDGNCNCYCVDIKMSGTSELCLSEGKLYINGRFERSGNHINIYYTGKAARTSDTEIPWDKFEKNVPIAVLNPTAKGFDLDWKGFSINGEIAVDYALYGKKTLEGTYKKK